MTKNENIPQRNSMQRNKLKTNQATLGGHPKSIDRIELPIFSIDRDGTSSETELHAAARFQMQRSIFLANNTKDPQILQPEETLVYILYNLTLL